MKWEILKGSEKDFEGAPEWALSVYYVSAVTGHLQAFSGAGMYQYLDGYSGTEDAGKAKEGNFASLGWCNTPKIIAERRPITEPDVSQQVTTEWDGSFPIPSGTCVDVHFQSDGYSVWTKFRVEYMRVDVVVLYDFRSDNVESYSNELLSFRPIRSAEDVARGAFVDAIVSFDLNRKTLSIDELYRDLYDAIAAGKIPGVKLE